MSGLSGDAASILPEDAAEALLIGRLWDPGTGGPRVVAVSGNEVVDISRLACTVSELLELPDPAQAVREALLDPELAGPRWAASDVVAASLEGEAARPHLLAPVDLQVIKACGVTFVDSMIERVI